MASPRSEARIAFQYPGFRYYLGARFLTGMASEMQAVAVGWQVYALTNRPLDLGLVGLAQFLPGIFLFLIAGHTADRVARRRILRACSAGFTLCSVLLALTVHRAQVAWPIYGILLLNGVVRAFNAPSGQAFLPQIVDAKDYPNAVTWSSSIYQTANVAGPVIGGFIYGWSGSPLPVYACAAVAYITAFGLISMVRVQTVQKPRGNATLGVVLDGLRYIWRNKLLLGATSLDLFAVLLGGAVALLPVYAKEILHVGTFGLGWLRSAPGIGAVAMAMLLAYRPVRRRSGLIMLWFVAGFGIFTIIFGLSGNTAISMAALILLGACDMVSVIIRTTLIQLSTPDENRGRVSAVNMLFIGASNELGQFESGITAQWFGAVPAVVLGGIGTIAIVALWAWRFPSLRRADQLAPPVKPNAASS